MSRKYTSSPAEQKAHYNFIHSIIDDIYATIAPEIGRSSYLGMKHKDIVPRYAYVKDLWNYHVVFPRKEANKNNQEYVISRAELWAKISHEPYAITWPLVNALYLSKDTDDATRLAIVTKHAKRFISMRGKSLFAKDLPIYDVVWNHLGKLDALSVSELAGRPETPKHILYSFAANRINFADLAKNPELDNQLLERLIDSNDGTVWENLLARGKKFSRAHAARMWFNTEEFKGDNLARLYAHPELLPINDISDYLDLKDTKSNFTIVFFEEFLLLTNFDMKVCQRAYKVITKKVVNEEELYLNTEMRVIKLLASTGYIGFLQWIEYVKLIELKRSERQAISIKGELIEKVLSLSEKKDVIDFFKKEHDIDVSGYSKDMIRSLLDW
jgi:hypothetical protein